MKKLLISSLSVFLCLSLLAQNATLKINLEKNKTYKFKSVSNQNISQTVNGMEQTTTSNSNSVFAIKMMDASQGFIVAEVKFDTIVNITNAMGKVVNTSSASQGNMASEEASEVMSAIMNRLSKNAIYVKMNETGKVMEIVNQAMLRDIILKDTGSISAKLKPMLIPQIQNTVSVDALKTMIEMYTYNLPGKPVNKGEQWTIAVPVNSGGMSLEIVTNYKLNDITNNTGIIVAESSVKASANAKPLEYPGAKITYDGISGMGKSDIKINTLTGLTLENVSKMNITGDLNVNASGMSMQIPMKISSESTIKSIQ